MSTFTQIFKNFTFVDKKIVIPVFLISLLGLAMVFSTTHQKGTYSYFYRQLTYFLIGFLLLIVFSRINYRTLCYYAWYLYAASVFLLIVTCMWGKGARGAVRWLTIVGSFSIQPAEPVKLAFVLTFARYLNNVSEKIQKIHWLLLGIVIAIIPLLLIIIQPDLGTASLLVPVFLSMLIFSGAQKKHILSLLGLGAISSPLAFQYFLKSYQKRRLIAFLNPYSDPFGIGYNIIQAKIAIGSGGFFGKGFLKGTQTQLGFVPEQHTDFIFSAIAEELGFIGTIFVLILYGFLISHIFSYAKKAKDFQGRLVALGIAMLFATHLILNLGMNCGIFPVVGVALPLISYGGSNLITFLIALGCVMSIGNRE